MILSGVVLAGGRSSRMGRDKALLEIGGQSLACRQVDLLRQAGCTGIFLSGRPGVDYGMTGITILFDYRPDLGPMAGIHAALDAMTGTHLLVVPVDLPLLHPSLLALLNAACTTSAGAVFSGSDGLEPLVAIYPRALAEAARASLESGHLSVQAFCRAAIADGLLRPVAIPPDETRAFLNANHPEDLESIKAAR